MNTQVIGDNIGYFSPKYHSKNLSRTLGKWLTLAMIIVKNSETMNIADILRVGITMFRHILFPSII